MYSTLAELLLMALTVTCIYRGSQNANYAVAAGIVLVLDLKRRPRKEREVAPILPPTTAVKVGRYPSTTQ